MTTNNYGKVLGKSETEVMEIVWQASEPVSVSEVVKLLTRKRPIAYTTVMTVMTHLTEKGLLEKEITGKAYRYKSLYSKESFLAKVSRQIINNLVATFGKTAVAQFAEELENLPSEKKEKLLTHIKKAKHERK